MDAFNQYLGRPDSAEIPSNAVLQALIRRYPWFTTARIVQSRISGKIDPELALRLTVRPVPDILLRSVGLSTVVDNTPCGTTYSSLETMSKREKLENAELQTDVSNVADQHEVAVNDTATLITESEALPVESGVSQVSIAQQEISQMCDHPSQDRSVSVDAECAFASESESESRLSEETMLVRENDQMNADATADQEQHRSADLTLEVIDRFLAEEPKRMVPREGIPEGDISADSVEEDDDMISEELAEIYRTQGLTERAKAIYTKLSLLYPEKSVYFAEIIDRINENPKD
jgi:hypothetical protein